MTEPEEKYRRHISRLEAFSDGVFAIAITLLALDLRLPPSTTAADLGSTLAAQGSHFYAFGLSFLIVGVYWNVHRRTFAHVVRIDEGFGWINLLVLLSVVFLPFATSVMASFGDTPTGVVLYASSLVVTGLAIALLWSYAYIGGRLVERAPGRREIRIRLTHSLVIPAIFGASIPVALRDPAAATNIWYAAAVFSLGFDLVAHRLWPRREST